MQSNCPASNEIVKNIQDSDGDKTQWTHVGVGLSSYEPDTDKNNIVVVVMLFSLSNSVKLTLKNADGSLQTNKSVTLVDSEGSKKFKVSFDKSPTVSTD